jgi:hypothetical protein
MGMSITAIILLISAISAPCLYAATDIIIQKNGSSNTAMPDARFTIEAIDNFSVIVTVDIPAISVSDADDQGIDFKDLRAPGFMTTDETGRPAVPAGKFAMIVPENTIMDLTVLDSQSTMLDDILPHPALPPATIRPDYINELPTFSMDEAIYGTDKFYPSNLASLVRIAQYRGVGIGHIRIAPVQCNPFTRKVRVYTHLKLAISFSGDGDLSAALSAMGRQTGGAVLENITVNGPIIRKRHGALGKVASNALSNAPDIIIVTIPAFKAAAETLSVWHNMKGYETKLAMANFPNWQAVQDTVHNLYRAINPHPRYLIILGDKEQVPAENLIGPFLKEQYLSDLNVVCMDGPTDWTPDMASGRISVSSADQAMQVVNKIIAYERRPPESGAFYRHFLSCAFFQDSDNNTKDGYEDRAFVKVCEDIKAYLETKGYAGQRIYTANSNVNPQYWNKTYYSWGEAIPTDLRRPGFAWDGDGADVSNGINAGSFLVYHYDHATAPGWGNPNFNINTMQISNGAMLPLVYSVNCLSGDFSSTECFAEKLLRRQNGGAVGVIASTGITLSGCNDALLVGMIDATWPGIKLTSPYNPDPKIPSHTPIYTFGDIFNQGLAQMSITWGEWDSLNIHYRIYHLFGDPTTPIWTSQPQDITVNHPTTVALTAGSFTISDLNISSGMATLFDPRTNTLIGRAEINNATTTVIPIAKELKSPGMAVLTITSHNFKPYIANIDAEPIVPNMPYNEQGENMRFTLYMNKHPVVQFSRDGFKDAKIALYNCQGKLLYKHMVTADAASCLHLPTGALANGLYYITATNGGRVLLSRQVYFLR